MNEVKPEDKLASYVNASRPIIYINHFDFTAVDTLIQEVTEVLGKPDIHEYNDAFGSVDFQWKNRKDHNKTKDLASFINLFYEEEGSNFLVLKDVHFHLEDPKIIALLKAIALKTLNPKQENFKTTIFIVASQLVIPTELEKLITVFDFPLLTQKQIEKIIREFAQQPEFDLTIEDNVVEELASSCKGLSELEITQILYLAYDDRGQITIDDKKVILQEKEQIIKKTGSLELVNFTETIDDIGGLEKLKYWLSNKATVFKQRDKAQKYGVDIPKGIMMVGMPGCGKSLVAKATSRLFEVPLLRLDIGQLLGKYVGESEANFSEAIKIAEAVSPCILWIDEIEKAFAGIGGSEGDGGVTQRLFGSFLTWLQEKENTVFVLATANDISKFPPEFLRKGRFDELFFVDLPNEEERKKIFEIHLQKRGQWNQDIDLNKLAKETEKLTFSGADIEAVVKETIETAFMEDKPKINTEDLMRVLEKNQTSSKSLEDKIKAIKELREKMKFKPAS